jgi:signal transduction histidine kinase
MTDVEKQIRELQSKLDRANDDLDRARAQLLHQEKLASLGQLTAGIAHEIKNPLNFVNNFAEVNVEMLQELREAHAAGQPLDEIFDALMVNAQRIGEHGRRASEIVRSMIQHDSASSGLRERTNLNALVSEHLALSYKSRQAHMPDLGVMIKQDLSRRVGKIEVVPRDIGWVILNLVNNAMDALHEFAPAQDQDYVPTIYVSTKRHDRDIEIRVVDNGPGIPAEDRDNIFQPFFTTKSTDNGTGLGLSLSYDIVTQGHGGTMKVESEEGKGATFVITLPDEKR